MLPETEEIGEGKKAHKIARSRHPGLRNDWKKKKTKTKTHPENQRKKIFSFNSKKLD